MGGTLAPDGLQRHPHRRSGGDAVVNGDCRAPADFRSRAARTIDLTAPLDLGELSRRLILQIALGDIQGGRQGVAPSVTAPTASSGCQGTPILRTSTISRGASSVWAISKPIATPPRGNARTTGCWSFRCKSSSASRRPASPRSAYVTI